jgi:Tfp pilus assembly protein PilV
MTLAEVLVSTLLIAIAVATVAAIFVSGGQQDVRIERSTLASTQLQQLLEELENFTTADSSNAADGPGGGWTLAGDTCGCWALQEGTHDVTARLPASLRNDAGARLTYTVAVEDRNGSPVRRVDAVLTWAN